jgi:DnaJ like chaperone protein
MSGAELAIIVIGACAGYWLVGFLFKGKAPAAPHADAPPGWPAVLGVGADASVDEIRAAYKRQISQYHPDKVASLGEELQQLASQKTQQINAAYAEALSARGATP